MNLVMLSVQAGVGVAALLVWTIICGKGDAEGINYLRLPTKNENESTSQVAFTDAQRYNVYPIISFNTNGATAESYGNFIRALREHIDSGLVAHGIPLARQNDAVPLSERFVLVELINSVPYNITLVIDVINVYVTGYQTGNDFYYFSEIENLRRYLFPDLRHHQLPFGSSYRDLEHEAGSRGAIELGMEQLEQAISHLHNYARPSLCRAFAVVIQMVSEAARYRYITDILQETITAFSSIVPTGMMLSLENHWGSLSTEIQHASDRIFQHNLTIIDMFGVSRTITKVTRSMVRNLAILLFVCVNAKPSSLSQLTSFAAWGDHDGICTPIPEPTIRIIGRDGLCVDVQGGNYKCGNPIILWPCRSDFDNPNNQLWTLKADGTIQSDGMCLTAKNLSPASYITICDCYTYGLSDAAKWEIWDNGTITNPKSSLMLSSVGESTEDALTLEDNRWVTGQGWDVGNDTKPIVTAITVNGNLCIHNPYRVTVTLALCVCQNKGQEWSVFPDGSIRLNSKRYYCLTENSNVVIINYCNWNDKQQRWSFNSDKSISNMFSGLAMEAEQDHIRMSTRSDTPKQEWDAFEHI